MLPLKNIHISKPSFLILIVSYLIIIIGTGIISESEIHSYIFSILVVIMGTFISWYLGGIKAAQYTSIFGLVAVALFTRQLWLVGVITSPQLFIAKSFILIYLMIFTMVYFFYKIQSPADAKATQDHEQLIEEKKHIANLEYMVANKKLTNDLLSEANLVKDELHIMEGNWRSALHDIVNDISSIKEREIYEKVIRPYNDNILKHLRELEERLSYEIVNQPLDELYSFIEDKIVNNTKLKNIPTAFAIKAGEWANSKYHVPIDRNKLWDIIRNIINNSMTAIDLKRIARIRGKDKDPFSPAISIHFVFQNSCPVIKIEDNGGGIEKNRLQKLYQVPISSEKRDNLLCLT